MSDQQSCESVVDGQGGGSTARKYARLGAQLPCGGFEPAQGYQIRPQSGELTFAKAYPCFVKQKAELNVVQGVNRASCAAHGI